MLEPDGIGAVYRKLRLCLGLFDHADESDEADEDEDEDEEKRHRLRWCRRDFRRIVEVTTRALLLGIALLVTPGIHQRAFITRNAIPLPSHEHGNDNNDNAYKTQGLVAFEEPR